jgi:hypothetical protein
LNMPTNSNATLLAGRPPFFDRDWVKAITFFTGIAGLSFGVFGFWAYFASIKEPEITYTLNPIRTTLVQAGAPAGLSVQFNGERLTEAVTSVTIGIWNAGRASVKAANVLEALQLKLPTNNRILSAKLLKQSRTVIGFQITNIGDPGALETRPQTALQLRFNILEHNDSAVVQIIYEGNPDADVTISGIIEGQPSILRLKEDKPIARTTGNTSPNGAVFRFIFDSVVGVLMGYFMVQLARTPSGPDLRRRITRFAAISVYASGAMFMVSSAWNVLYDTLIRPPPFSFGG